MNDFFDSQLCKNEGRCRECRLSRSYRQGIIKTFDNPVDEDFECPKGKTADDYPQEIEASLFEMAKDVALAPVQEAGAVIRGKPKVTEEEYNKRLEICKGCQFFKASSFRCTKCGCKMRLKARLRSKKCPIGKW